MEDSTQLGLELCNVKILDPSEVSLTLRQDSDELREVGIRRIDPGVFQAGEDLE